MSAVPRPPRIPRLLATLCAVVLLSVPAVAQDDGEGSPSILRDAETEAFFRDISKPLILAAGLDPRNVQVILINDPSINAFAAGGQNVFIHSGLMVAADSANQLQGVIAHELGHIAAGHLVRFNEGAGPATNISILSLVLAAAAVAAGAPSAGMALLSGGLTAAQGKFLAFSRDTESRADAAGAKFLSIAHISGRGSIEFFNKLLGQEYRLAIKQDNEYDRTHPLDGTRIANLEAQYKADPAWNNPVDPALQARFLRIKGKLIGYIEEPPRVLQRYPESDGSEPAHYARAYAYHRSAYPEAAQREVDKLLALHPADPFYLELKGQMLLENGGPAEAIPVLRKAVAADPNEPLIATLLGHALISTDNDKDFAEAEPILKKAIAQDRENPFAWYQLGVIYDHQHDEARAALAQAESFNLSGAAKSAAAKARFARAGLPQGSRDWLRADDIAEAACGELGNRKLYKKKDAC